MGIVGRFHALRFVGTSEAVASLQEFTATTTRQADPVEVVFDRIGTHQAEFLQLFVAQYMHGAIGHRGHQVVDLGRRAVAFQVVAQFLAERAQFLAQFLARGRRRTHPDHPMDADRPDHHPHVAGRKDQHAGAVAHRIATNPDRPVVLADGIAGTHRRLHAATGGIDVEDALADTKVAGKLADTLGQGGETRRDLALVAQPHQPGGAAVLHGRAQVDVGQRQHRLAVTLAIVRAAIDRGIAGLQPDR